MNIKKIDENGVPKSASKHFGVKYNMLTVLSFERQEKQSNGTSFYYFVKCVCDCGAIKTLNVNQVASGRVKSCGCYSSKLKSERFSKHKKSRTTIYVRHRAMISRCYNSKTKKYHIYGGRGISVCIGWRGDNGFVNFYSDMGEVPFGHTLDRIDSNGNYSCGKCSECLENGWPLNCRWATPKTQANNTKRNKYLKVGDENKSYTEVAQMLGIKQCNTIKYRVESGWSIKDILSTGTDSQLLKPNKNIVVLVNGQEMSMAQAERALGYRKGVISARLKNGWSKEDAVLIPPKHGNRRNK